MTPQIYSTEVSTKIPLKTFITKYFPWYRENSYTHGPQTIYPLSSMSDLRLSYWTMSSHFQVNSAYPIPVVLYSSIDEILQIHSIDTLTNTLENFVAEKFAAILEVEYVFISLENDSVDIWTVINNLDREIRKKIYDVEYDILAIISHFHFDFHVIYRNDRSIEELYPSNAKMIFQK